MNPASTLPLSASERLIEHGLKLIAKAAVEPPDAAERARASLAKWRLTSPAHEAAATEAQRRWQLLGGIAADVRDRFEPAPPAPSRRQALRGLAAFAGCAVLTGSAGGWYWWRQPVFEQRYATGTAEFLTVALPDLGHGTGSRLDLNARTRVWARLYRHQRVVVLDEGEARFDIARDPERPFLVDTRLGRITVLGTAFTVKDRGGPVSIHVEHGHVRFDPRVKPGEPALPTVDLRAGQALTLRPGQPAQLRSAIDAGQASAWRDGWLVFDNTRLDEALPAINAHRAQPITLADDSVGRLPLTGRFKAADSASLLAALPAILPLSVQALPDGRVALRATRSNPP
ncbi:MAG: FecR domain-containing protein [Aquabacterium sp.]|jgi:transmembrane sensor|uniref:FecR family protein n=1 Tax=Aquabacterium sp. TaxID=1872578 RepID=UPI003BB0381B